MIYSTTRICFLARTSNSFLRYAAFLETEYYSNTLNMSHQRLSHLTCRVIRHRSSFAEFVRQDRRRPIWLSSTILHTQHATYSSITRHTLRSSRNILFANRPTRSLQPLVKTSSAFSTTNAPRTPASATLNPRVDDDGNPMFIEISPRAVKRLSEITTSSAENQYLRVAVTSGGCHGFQYQMSLEPSSKIDEEEDTVFELAGEGSSPGQAKVVMDLPSLELLSGSTVDFTTELIGSQFKVNNPRATSSCGCGTSFDVSL